MYRSALFCDVDNMYSCLRDTSPEAADALVKSPARWLEWLVARGDGRGVLLRNAYINPSKYGYVREDFLRAGFRVAECPSLTGKGKSSADMHLLLDAVDALQHPAHYDEFIFLSSDADFTPLLRRVREHGRRTMLVLSGPASLAYLGCADEVVSAEEFAREALGVTALAAEEGDLLARMARRMVEWVKTAGDLQVRDVPRFLQQFPEFTRGSNWLGHHSVRALAEAIVQREPTLQILGGRADWSITVAAMPAPVVEAAS